jgi:hypothetical protein
VETIQKEREELLGQLRRIQDRRNEIGVLEAALVSAEHLLSMIADEFDEVSGPKIMGRAASSRNTW